MKGVAEALDAVDPEKKLRRFSMDRAMTKAVIQQLAYQNTHSIPKKERVITIKKAKILSSATGG